MSTFRRTRGLDPIDLETGAFRPGIDPRAPLRPASSVQRFASMKFFRSVVISLCAALALAACGGGDLSVDLPGGSGDTRTRTALELDFPPGRAVEHRLPFRVSGGLPPYSSSVEGCPDWVTLFPVT